MYVHAQSYIILPSPQIAYVIYVYYLVFVSYMSQIEAQGYSLDECLCMKTCFGGMCTLFAETRSWIRGELLYQTITSQLPFAAATYPRYMYCNVGCETCHRGLAATLQFFCKSYILCHISAIAQEVVLCQHLHVHHLFRVFTFVVTLKSLVSSLSLCQFLYSYSQ